MRKPVTKRRPKKTTPTSLPSDLIREADRVDPQERLSIVREDEADNRILECAVAADADAIVTGDRHPLRLRRDPTALTRSTAPSRPVTRVLTLGL